MNKHSTKKKKMNFKKIQKIQQQNQPVSVITEGKIKFKQNNS